MVSIVCRHIYGQIKDDRETDPVCASVEKNFALLSVSVSLHSNIMLQQLKRLQMYQDILGGVTATRGLQGIKRCL